MAHHPRLAEREANLGLRRGIKSALLGGIAHVAPLIRATELFALSSSQMPTEILQSTQSSNISPATMKADATQRVRKVNR